MGPDPVAETDETQLDPAAPEETDPTRILEKPPDEPDSAATPAAIDGVAVGRKLGNFRLNRVIGQGGMGVVYQATDEELHRDVAIKVLPARLLADPKAGARLLREARAVARLDHPNVVRILDLEKYRGGYYLVLEYVDGGSMADALDSGPLPWPEATRLTVEACRGLAAAHAKGLVHRDIKPANLLRTRDGQVKLTDFGLAKEPGDSRSLTATDKVVGTPSFMSPEQCQQEPLDPRSDVYSLGATYYALLTGTGPYDAAGSPTQVMFAHCYAPVPDLREIRPEIPEPVAEVIRCALAKEPSERYQSVDAMRADLEKLLVGQEPEAAGREYTPPTRPPILGDQPTDHTEPVRGPRPGAPRRDWLLIPVALGGLVAAIGLVVGAALLLAPKGPSDGPIASRPPRGGASVDPRRPAPTPGPAPSAAPRPPAGDPVRVGLLHSRTGQLGPTEEPAIRGALLAIDELNARGGVLGRRVEAIRRDGASDPAAFGREAARLIDDDKVVVIFGGWSSASRKAIREVVENRRHLLVYPASYEGLERSPHILYTGALPNQVVLPAVGWAYGPLGRRFALVGADDLYSNVVNRMIRHRVEELRGEVVVEHRLAAFTPDQVLPLVAEIQAKRPSAILSTLPGLGHVALVLALRSAGVTAESIPTLAFRIDAAAVQFAGGPSSDGDFVARSYFADPDSPRPPAREFARRYYDRYAVEATDGSEAAYVGVRLWAAAAEAARDVAPDAVRRALPGRTLDDAPEGPIRVDDSSLQLWKFARAAVVDAEGRLKIVLNPQRPIRPNPFPPPLSEAGWREFLDQLHERWGGWQPPAAP
jgi:urea transport system substrate-binding protein